MQPSPIPPVQGQSSGLDFKTLSQNFAKEGRLNGYLIAGSNGSLGQTNLVNFLFEKLKGYCGYESMADSNLVKKSASNFLIEHLSDIKNDKDILMVVALANQAGLTEPKSRTVKSILNTFNETMAAAYKHADQNLLKNLKEKSVSHYKDEYLHKDEYLPLKEQQITAIPTESQPAESEPVKDNASVEFSKNPTPEPPKQPSSLSFDSPISNQDSFSILSSEVPNQNPITPEENTEQTTPIPPEIENVQENYSEDAENYSEDANVQENPIEDANNFILIDVHQSDNILIEDNIQAEDGIAAEREPSGEHPPTEEDLLIPKTPIPTEVENTIDPANLPIPESPAKLDFRDPSSNPVYENLLISEDKVDENNAAPPPDSPSINLNLGSIITETDTDTDIDLTEINPDENVVIPDETDVGPKVDNSIKEVIIDTPIPKARENQEWVDTLKKTAFIALGVGLAVVGAALFGRQLLSGPPSNNLTTPADSDQIGIEKSPIPFWKQHYASHINQSPFEISANGNVHKTSDIITGFGKPSTVTKIPGPSDLEEVRMKQELSRLENKVNLLKGNVQSATPSQALTLFSDAIDRDCELGVIEDILAEILHKNHSGFLEDSSLYATTSGENSKLDNERHPNFLEVVEKLFEKEKGKQVVHEALKHYLSTDTESTLFTNSLNILTAAGTKRPADIDEENIYNWLNKVQDQFSTGKLSYEMQTALIDRIQGLNLILSNNDHPIAFTRLNNCIEGRLFSGAQNELANPFSLECYKYKTTSDPTVFKEAHDFLVKAIEKKENLADYDSYLARNFYHRKNENFSDSKPFLIQQPIIDLSKKLFEKGEGTNILKKLLSFPDITQMGSVSSEIIKEVSRSNPSLLLSLFDKRNSENKFSGLVNLQRLISTVMDVKTASDGIGSALKEILTNDKLTAAELPQREILRMFRTIATGLPDANGDKTEILSVIRQKIPPENNPLEELFFNYKTTQHESIFQESFNQILSSIKQGDNLKVIDQLLADTLFDSKGRPIPNIQNIFLDEKHGLPQLVDELVRKSSGNLVISKSIEALGNPAFKGFYDRNLKMIEDAVEKTPQSFDSDQSILPTIDQGLALIIASLRESYATNSLEKIIELKSDKDSPRNLIESNDKFKNLAKKLFERIDENIFSKENSQKFLPGQSLLNIASFNYRMIRNADLKKGIDPIEFQIVEAALETLENSHEFIIIDSIFQKISPLAELSTCEWYGLSRLHSNFKGNNEYFKIWINNWMEQEINEKSTRKITKSASNEFSEIMDRLNPP